MTKTAWLLDIDGVINGGSRCGWHSPPRRTDIVCTGPVTFRIRWEPQLINRIKAARSAGVDVRWATTWCGFPDDLGRLSSRLGIELPYGIPSTRPPHLTWGDLKATAAREVVLVGDRLIWTDDTEVDAARDLFPELRDAERAGQALLIAPDAARALRPEHLDLIDRFAAGEKIFPETLAADTAHG
jgi:hypothetical protein